jgi:hypothetical protein
MHPTPKFIISIIDSESCVAGHDHQNHDSSQSEILVENPKHASSKMKELMEDMSLVRELCTFVLTIG